MKIVYAFLVWFLVLNPLISQSTFDYRFHFGYPALVLTGVVSTDSCVYAIGVMVDSIAPFYEGNIFIKFSLEGEVLIQKVIVDSIRTYEIWRGNLAQCPDGGFAAFGTSVKDSRLKGLMIKYDSSGDSLFTKLFPNYYNDTLFIRGEDILTLEDGGFLILSTDSKPDEIKHTEIRVSRLDNLGNLEWSKIFGISSTNDIAKCIIPYRGAFAVSGSRNNSHIAVQNYIFRDFVMGVSASGEKLWEYLSPINELHSFVSGLVEASDGGLFVVSGNGVEVPAGPGFSQMRWHNYAFKLDSNRQVEWGILIRDSLPAISPNNQLTSGIELQDGSGYAVAGNLIARTPENWFFSGVLAKISPEGELLWKRYYQHIAGQGPSHYINDLAQAPDGGFIMVGEVRDTVNAPRQQGWLLKVDEYGCLVPGCELVNSAEETKTGGDAKVNLLLYPNPVGEQLQLYFSAEESAEYAFRILDAQGREWRRFSTHLSEVTLLVELGELPGGVYYLQCLRNGKVVGVEGFVKR